MADAPQPEPTTSAAPVARWIWGFLAGVALLTTAAGATLSVAAIAAVHDLPRAVVARYLGELQHGRAEAAMRLAGIRAGVTDVLLTDAAYAKITDRINGFTLQPAVTRGSRTTVEATISQGDRTYQRSFAVEQSGGVPGLTFWKLAPLQPDTVALKVNGPAGLTFTVAGVHPKSMPIGAGFTLRALPGTYPVAFTSSSEDFAVPSADVTATPADGTVSPTDFTAHLSSAGDAAGRAAIDTWLDGCVASTAADTKGCPFYTFSPEQGVAITGVQWHLDSRPVVDVDREWTEGGWAVSADSGSVSGEVDFLRSSDGATGTGSLDAFAFDFTGFLLFDDSGALFVPLYGDGTGSDSGA